MFEIIITVYSDKYRPISASSKISSKEEYNSRREYYKQQALLRLCAFRGMTLADLRKYGYNKMSIREYTPELKQQYRGRK